MPYRVKTGFLEKGDIILTDGDALFKGEKDLRGKITSSGIKFFLDSNFSHVAIYLGGTYAEAIDIGVRYSNLSKQYFKNKDGIRILRYNNLNQDQIFEIKNYIALRQGVPYSTKMALKSANESNVLNNTFEQFCSKLVAEAYLSAGIELFKDKTCQNVHPGDYEKCNLLNNINVEFDELSEEEALANPQLFGQEKSIRKLNKIFKKIYKKNDMNFNSVNQTLTDFIFLPENKYMDSEIANALIKTSYTTFWEEEMSVNIHMYDYQEKYRYFHKKNKEEILFENIKLINTSIDEIKRFYTELFQLKYLENKLLRKEISQKKLIDQKTLHNIFYYEELYKDSILDSSEIRKVLIDLYSNLLKKTKKM